MESASASFKHLVNNEDGKPVLLWADGPWLTLMTGWERPFDQHDIVDFLHCLLPGLDPCFYSSL